jgi:uncharacterized protein (TIGR02145 family)
MKKPILALMMIILGGLALMAQDTLYMMRNGQIVIKRAVTEIDSIIFYPPETQTGTVTDIEGNVYRTITIGGQTWMAENLKTSKYNNSTSIPQVTDSAVWRGLTNGAYCYYNNDIELVGIVYGKIYNGYAVVTGNLCPFGWHVPTTNDWDAMIKYLGGKEVAGGKLKETGTAHWTAPNTGATNATGFSALPGGGRGYSGSFGNGLGLSTDFWSGVEILTLLPIYGLSNDNAKVSTGFSVNKGYGYYVRCIKD